jgi:hypothetical protein
VALAVAVTAGASACSNAKTAPSMAAPEGNDGGAPTPDAAPPARPVPEIVADFVKAWNATDSGERNALLAASFVAEGVYTDPAQVVQGRDALSAAIDGFQQTTPDVTLVATTSIDLIPGQYRFAWSLTSKDGTTVQAGEDEGALDGTGKIVRVTGFFDPPVPATSPAGLETLLLALNAKKNSELEMDLAKAVTDDCAWADEGGPLEETSQLATHLEMLVSPGSGARFERQSDVDTHDDFFRTSVTVSGGYAAHDGQLFGHVGSDGRLDSVMSFDGDLLRL